jgi:4-hydroxybenzoate polyprenyltransferase
LGIVDSWSRPSNLANVVIFILGGVIMRSAGCVINDYADRHVDEHAERTQHRPLAHRAQGYPKNIVTLR